MALPTIDFAAPIIRAAILSLQAGMPGQVATFNAEPANTVDLQEPQTYVFGAEPIHVALPMPVVEVAAVGGDLGNFTVGRATADHDAAVNVAAWVQGEQGQVPALYEQVVGLARCIIECLVPTGAFGSGVELAQDLGVSWRADVIPADPTASSPQEGRDIQVWTGSALMQFRVQTIESFA